MSIAASTLAAGRVILDRDDMTDPIAALPMYDWPEVRDEVDAEWARIRDALRGAGIAAPDALSRRNADLPAVPGGIRDANGASIAPDPVTLPPDDLDFHALWLHPKLLFAQTCWGPMEQGLARHVRLVGQPGYDGIEGGQGAFYSSAILTRRAGVADRSAPCDGAARLPLDLMRSKRFAYNGLDSMSGVIALGRDLEALGEGLDIFSVRVVTGAHRSSLVAVAEGRADVCAIDCRTLAMARRFEPALQALAVTGWTARRKGLPYIMSTALAAQRPRVARAAGVLPV